MHKRNMQHMPNLRSCDGTTCCRYTLPWLKKDSWLDTYSLIWYRQGVHLLADTAVFLWFALLQLSKPWMGRNEIAISPQPFDVLPGWTARQISHLQLIMFHALPMLSSLLPAGACWARASASSSSSPETHHATIITTITICVIVGSSKNIERWGA